MHEEKMVTGQGKSWTGIREDSKRPRGRWVDEIRKLCGVTWKIEANGKVSGRPLSSSRRERAAYIDDDDDDDIDLSLFF